MTPLVVLVLMLAAAVAGAATALGGYRSARRRALLVEVSALRFSAYVALVRRALTRRGYTTESRLGAAQADSELEASRDGRRLLVACKLGSSVRVATSTVLALDRARAAADADGALVFTSGSVDADARSCAAERGIEIADGAAFEREIRAALDADLAGAVRAGTRTALLQCARRGVAIGLLSAAAGASAVAVATHV